MAGFVSLPNFAPSYLNGYIPAKKNLKDEVISKLISQTLGAVAGEVTDMAFTTKEEEQLAKLREEEILNQQANRELARNRDSRESDMFAFDQDQALANEGYQEQNMFNAEDARMFDEEMALRQVEQQEYRDELDAFEQEYQRFRDEELDEENRQYRLQQRIDSQPSDLERRAAEAQISVAESLTAQRNAELEAVERNDIQNAVNKFTLDNTLQIDENQSVFDPSLVPNSPNPNVRNPEYWIDLALRQGAAVDEAPRVARQMSAEAAAHSRDLAKAKQELNGVPIYRDDVFTPEQLKQIEEEGSAEMNYSDPEKLRKTQDWLEMLADVNPIIRLAR